MKLTPAEERAVRLYGTGMKPCAIARLLGRSHKTICTQLSRAQKKKKLDSRFHLLAWAVKLLEKEGKGPKLPEVVL